MNPDSRNAARKRTILIIDDEEVVRLLFDSLLQEEGYITLLAEDGRQGVEMLNHHSPALALVDKNLPDISGLDLIATEKKRHPDTEFIMITGYASLDSAVRAMEVGAFSYLTKPFVDMDVVMDRVRAALEVSNLRQETSTLRNRLDAISGEVKRAAPAAAGVPAPLAERLRRILKLLESFLGRRNQPPAEAAWARLVDMIEEECRRLRRLIEDLSKPQG